MTAYVVLHKVDLNNKEPLATSSNSPGEGWSQVGPPVECVSAEAAIRKAVDGDKGGTYVAVPVRSWAPVTVTVETKRTLKLA